MKTEVSIPERLKDLRVEKKLTLEELSGLTGISKSALGSYEADDNNNNKEINHGSILKLADFYEVSTDYLLCLTNHRNHPNTGLAELHLSDEMVGLLKSGRINNRLLCEIATHDKFKRLMADAEIYVDGVATMRIRDLNRSLEAARRLIISRHPEADGDRNMMTLEAGQIQEEDFFCHITHKSWDAILHDIRKAHINDAESAPDKTPADEVVEIAQKIAQSPGDKTDKFIQMLCHVFQIKDNRLEDGDKSILKKLAKLSPLAKSSGEKSRRRKK